MKTNKRFFVTTVIMLVAYLLSACGGLPQQADQSSGEQAAIKVRAVEVAYTGVIDAINGSEWTVNGQLLTVDPAVVQDGPFQVGDTVKIEGEVNLDGSIIVLGVELPSASDLTDLPQLGNDNANDNVNSNDDNSNDDNANDNANSNDDNSNDDNANDNGNDNDDDNNANGNSNDSDDDDDDDNGNSNGNNIDDDDDDDYGSSGNSNGSGNGGSSEDSHDDDSGSNSNGSDDDND